MNNRKAAADDYAGRIAEVVNDPNNAQIPRHPDAGQRQGDCIIAHNGLRVRNDIYGQFAQVLVANRGVHEPQEERVFAEVLKCMPPGATMIELGAYWAFYSMWFQSTVPGAKNFMVEPAPENLQMGKDNFALNGFTGDFTQGFVGNNGVQIDSFVKEKGIKHIDLLHADIQGAEMEMLQGAREMITSGHIDYFFISTHTQRLHYDCALFLEKCGYEIIASADFDRETYCFDGVLVARAKRIAGVGPIPLHRANWKTGRFFTDLLGTLGLYHWAFRLARSMARGEEKS